MSIYYPNIINPNDPVSGSSVPFSNPMTGILDMGNHEVINASQASQPNSLTTLSQVSQLISASGGGGGGGWVPTATSALNMVGNGIDQADYVDFVNQDGNNGIPLSIQARIINSKPVLTIETHNDTQQGIIYDSFFNPLPASGGGWVPTATSDLNMATHSITGVQGMLYWLVE